MLAAMCELPKPLLYTAPCRLQLKRPSSHCPSATNRQHGKEVLIRSQNVTRVNHAQQPSISQGVDNNQVHENEPECTWAIVARLGCLEACEEVSGRLTTFQLGKDTCLDLDLLSCYPKGESDCSDT